VGDSPGFITPVLTPNPREHQTRVTLTPFQSLNSQTTTKINSTRKLRLVIRNFIYIYIYIKQLIVSLFWSCSAHVSLFELIFFMLLTRLLPTLTHSVYYKLSCRHSISFEFSLVSFVSSWRPQNSLLYRFSSFLP